MDVRIRNLDATNPPFNSLSDSHTEIAGLGKRRIPLLSILYQILTLCQAARLSKQRPRLSILYQILTNMQLGIGRGEIYLFQFSIRFSLDVIDEIIISEMEAFNSLSDSHELPRTRVELEPLFAFNSLSDSHVNGADQGEARP